MLILSLLLTFYATINAACATKSDSARSLLAQAKSVIRLNGALTATWYITTPKGTNISAPSAEDQRLLPEDIRMIDTLSIDTRTLHGSFQRLNLSTWRATCYDFFAGFDLLDSTDSGDMNTLWCIMEEESRKR